MIDHPLIVEQRQTCYGCPEQYEGKLVSGLWFYFRYRHGWASLACGPDSYEVAGRSDVGMAHGDSLQGVFESAEARNAVFYELFVEWTAQAIAREMTQ